MHFAIKKQHGWWQSKFRLASTWLPGYHVRNCSTKYQHSQFQHSKRIGRRSACTWYHSRNKRNILGHQKNQWFENISIHSGCWCCHQRLGPRLFGNENRGTKKINYSEPRRIRQCWFSSMEHSTQCHFNISFRMHIRSCEQCINQSNVTQ